MKIIHVSRIGIKSKYVVAKVKNEKYILNVPIEALTSCCWFLRVNLVQEPAIKGSSLRYFKSVLEYEEDRECFLANPNDFKCNKCLR